MLCIYYRRKQITKPINQHIMKKILLMLALYVGLGAAVNAQSIYSTTGGELIFSWADVDFTDNSGSTIEGNDVLRFSPVINIYNYWHLDVNDYLGFMLGIGTHNIGFITDVPQKIVDESSLSYTGSVRKKFRNYTLGIPVGVKVGLMKSMYLYGGYEIEFPYLYKEKTFVDGDKQQKYTKWFADQAPTMYNSFFIGVQMDGGTSIKFHYYMDDFFDQDYVQGFSQTDGRNFYPTKANMMYISISQTIFKGTKFVKPAAPSNNGARAALRFR